MKHIKLFESFDTEPSSYKPYPSEQNVADCFVDLVDSGFSVDVDETLKVTIHKGSIMQKSCMFNISDLEEVLLFAIPYLKDTYDEEVFTCRLLATNKKFRGMYNKEFKTIEEFMDYCYELEEEEKPLWQVEIEFIRN